MRMTDGNMIRARYKVMDNRQMFSRSGTFTLPCRSGKFSDFSNLVLVKVETE